MAVELNDLDLRILDLLLKDGRTPAAQIAEQIGLSRTGSTSWSGKA